MTVDKFTQNFRLFYSGKTKKATRWVAFLVKQFN